MDTLARPPATVAFHSVYPRDSHEQSFFLPHFSSLTVHSREVYFILINLHCFFFLHLFVVVFLSFCVFFSLVQLGSMFIHCGKILIFFLYFLLLVH